MKIDDDHLYHGAALIQIAEDDRFTAINVMRVSGKMSRSAYRINDDIGVYLKYASRPTPSYGEYGFTFVNQHLRELAEIDRNVSKTFVALVCVKDRQICCLNYSYLLGLVAARREAKGTAEDQYIILTTLPENSQFRVYVNQPGARKTILGKQLLVARGAFPSAIFD